jgi:hypothetical protein
LSADLSYPADVATVAALLSDEEFLRRRAEQAAADGGGIDQVDLTGSLAEGFTTIVRRTMSTSIIPAQLRPFVGDHLLVRQTEVWEPLSDDRMVGTVAVEITGVPVRVTGTMVLEPAEGGSHQVYDGEIKASVPLFGGIVEDATSGAIRATLDAEAAATVDRLQSNG